MNKSFGPLSADEFQSLVSAPYGAAVKTIRKYDPLYGKVSTEGELVKWKVTLQKEVTMTGYVIVEAATEEDAENIADTIDENKIDWDEEESTFPMVIDARQL